MNFYHKIFASYLQDIENQGRYRHFVTIERNLDKLPYAFCPAINDDVVLWCSNDYLGMGLNADVIKATTDALLKYGIGAGGTRNISGNSVAVVQLEELLARLHQKEAGLLFSSGYVANQNALFALGRICKDLLFLSDANNHASLIAGINYSRNEKLIFEHNCVQSLEGLLQSAPLERPKMIVCESIYSMNGAVAPLVKICDLARKYRALIFLDEVHAVALYGQTGAGVAESLGVSDQIDIIQGTLGKGFGAVGGYIAAKKDIIESIRHAAPGFIFTTALPPLIAAGAKASIEHVMADNHQRLAYQEAVKIFKEKLRCAKIAFIDNPSHIIPVMIGDAKRAQHISTYLLQEHKIYVQHINYPTVPKGTERLRVIVTPFHTQSMMDEFISSLQKALNYFTHTPCLSKIGF